MKQFITKHERDIVGVLSGWDRVRFRGTIRMLAYVNGLMGWLCERNVLLKHFKSFSMQLTATLKESVATIAETSGHSVQYLASSTLSKEDLVRELLRRENVSEGLVSCAHPIVAAVYGPCLCQRP